MPCSKRVGQRLCELEHRATAWRAGPISNSVRSTGANWCLVHDLRRSGVNEQHIEFDDRLVLPRLRDALEDV